MNILKVWAFWQEEIKYHDHYLAEEMHRLGHETTFLVPDKTDPALLPFLRVKAFEAGTSHTPDYRVVRLRSYDFHGKFIITDWATVAKILNEDFDVVHIFGISNMISFLVLTMLMLRRRRPVIVVNDHSHPEDNKASLAARVYYSVFKTLYRWYAPMVARLIVPNLPSKRYLSQRYGIQDQDIFRIIPLGFNQRVFTLTAGARNTEPRLVVGFAGKLYPEKRLEVLIRAVAQFSSDDVQLIIAGTNLNDPSPYQSKLVALTQSLAMTNVEFRGFIKAPTDLARFYAHLDVAAFPGSLSITTLEASGCGTPVVLLRSTEGLEDRVDNGRGVLFDTEAELVGVLRNYLAAKRGGRIDHRQIWQQSQRYGWQEIAKTYLALYQAEAAAWAAKR